MVRQVFRIGASRLALLWVFAALLGPVALWSQQIQIGPNAKEITTDDQFTLSVTLSGISGGQIPQPRFPDIKGLQTGMTSSSQNWINGAVSVTFSKSYIAPNPGKYAIPALSYSFKGINAEMPAFTLNVKKGTGRKQQQSQGGFFGGRDPFQDFFNDPFFGGRGTQTKPEEMKFQSLSADYFMSVNLDKESCYIGEQVHGNVVLYINELDARKIKVDGQAIAEMQQRIKNSGFWQEIIELKEITGERQRINGKNYIAYTLYKTVLFPIKTGDIEFNDIYLNGMKLAVATNADPISRFMGRDTKFEAIKIKAADRRLVVKPLPPTQLTDANMVGKFKMEAGLNRDTINTGENLELEVKIGGNGNMAMMADISPSFPESFEVYEPTTTYNSMVQGNGLVGDKTWKWSMLPTRSGDFDLGPLRFYFYDPEAGHYDSLIVPELKVKVVGDDIENQRIGKSGSDAFYEDALKSSGNKLSASMDLNGIALGIGFTIVATVVVIAMVRANRARKAPAVRHHDDFWNV